MMRTMAVILCVALAAGAAGATKEVTIGGAVIDDLVPDPRVQGLLFVKDLRFFTGKIADSAKRCSVATGILVSRVQFTDKPRKVEVLVTIDVLAIEGARFYRMWELKARVSVPGSGGETKFTAIGGGGMASQKYFYCVHLLPIPSTDRQE